MKTLIFTDLHFNRSFFSRESLTSNEIEKAQRFLMETVKAEKPDLIVNIGDSFHNVTKEYVIMHMVALRNLYKDMLSYAPMIIVSGNHDYIDFKKGEYDLNTFYENLHNEKNGISVIAENKVVVKTYDALSAVFIFIPAIYKRDFLLNTFNVIKESIEDSFGHYKHKFVFGHFNIEEAFGSRAMVSDAVSLVNISFLSMVNRLYLGHYHLRKSLNKNKVQYIGAVRATQFDELEDTKRGCLILDLKNESFSEKYIDNPYSSVFFKQTTDSLDEKFSNYFFNENRNHYLKILQDPNKKHIEMLLDNYKFIKKFDHIEKEYDTKDDEVNDLLSLDIDTSSASELKDFLVVLKDYLLKSSKYDFSNDEINATNILLSQIEKEDINKDVENEG